MLSTSADILDLVNHLQGCQILAFDTEFIRESTFFPIVEIIQIATETDSWLVDAQAFKRTYRSGDPLGYDPALKPLLEIFADPKILKVVHASQGDQECLYTSFGVVATPTLDTAVAASLCGLGESIGLGKLLKAVLDVTVSKGHARTNWSVRPLPHQLIEYAHADVKHLVLLGKTLLGQLEKLGRKDWALELSAKWEDPKLYQSDPSEIAQKLARGGRFDANGYAALMALVQWREQRVRQLNLPRRWVADDHVLVDLAHVRPKDIAHLSSFRGLNKGELKNSGEAILAALRQGSEGSDQPVPQFKKPNLPTEDELQALEVLRCFLGILADRHKIAAKHLMTAAKLLPLLRTNVESPQEWVLQGVLSAEAVELIGDELVAMIQGKRSLLIKNRRVEVMNISTDRQRDSLADA